MDSYKLLQNKSNENAMKLAKLAMENPELPIFPWVDCEIVADDSWGRWLGSFGDCWVGECAVYKDQYDECRFFSDRDEFKEHYYDYNDDELCKKFNYNPAISEYSVKNGKNTQEELDANNRNEKLLDHYLDKIAEECFVKVIFVDIDLPDA